LSYTRRSSGDGRLARAGGTVNGLAIGAPVAPDLLGLATAALAEDEPGVLIIGHAAASRAPVAAKTLLERAA